MRIRTRGDRGSLPHTIAVAATCHANASADRDEHIDLDA
jgi:hypothetical protein